jgi:hypothetical protein
MATVTEDEYEYESGDVLENISSGRRCEVGDLLYVVDKGVREYLVYWQDKGKTSTMSAQSAEQDMRKVNEK